MKPKYEASLEFLQHWRSGGPWILTAISLDKKNISTVTCTAKDEVLRWLAEHGAKRNVYFSVNPARKPVNKKPLREDVASMDWLHVDIDPRAGEDITAEQQRALKLLQQPPEGLPPPTVIVFSGGGYQGFWKLGEPFKIDGEPDRYEQAKRYNMALELAFGADNCHNVDRIMRLPGTINRPDERKKKKGRKPALAKLIEWHDDRVYSYDQFTPAPAIQTEAKGFGTTQTVQVSGNVARVADVNDIAGISDLCKVIIVQGADPDNPSRFPSRSEALWYVCCELVRADVDDDTIYAILTDSEFAISASILDKGRNAESYAVRQIEKAREEAIDPNLRKMNEKYAVITFGGKVRVIFEERDPILNRYQLVKMAFEDLRNLHMNQKVQIGTDANGNPRFASLGKWWLEHPNRRQYTKLTFAPGHETPGAYNMWRGFSVDPVPGDKHESFLGHVRDNVCQGDEELYTYIIGWLAYAVQKPGEPAQTALVLRGSQGAGKGFLARSFGDLFGRHFLHVSSAQRLTGNFNAHLRDCVVLFADEAFYAGDKRHASTLRTLVTEDSLLIEPKGVDTEVVPNCLHLIMASNEEWVVPADVKERRFCVIDVGEGQLQNAQYFGAIAADLAKGGYSNLLHFLLTMDLAPFHVRKLPQTAALREQKLMSMGADEEWWYQKLVSGKLIEDDDQWRDAILIEELTDDYLAYMSDFNISRRGCATKLGQFLRRAMPRLVRRQSGDNIKYGKDRVLKRPYLYIIPLLSECRAHWDEHFGGPYPWPPVEDIGTTEEEKIPF